MNNQDFSFDVDKLNDYKLYLESGERTSPDGQTRVVLHGSGYLKAEQVKEQPENRGKKVPVSIEGEIEDAGEVFKQAENFDWQRKFPSRPGIPDEAIVTWTVEYQDEKIATVKIWLREAEEDDRFKVVLNRLKNVVGKLSDNQIYI